MTRQLLGKYKTCLNCGKEEYLPPYRLETYKFCSRKCGYKYKLKNERVELNCQVCKTKFSVIGYRQKTAKYCSKKCYTKGMIGRGNTSYKCLYCSTVFLGSQSHKRKYCSRACNGKSRKETFKPKFTTVRKAMLARGLINKCERCGFNQYPQILGVHHKDRNRNNNEINNLEVLCPNCHSIEHMKHTPHGYKE